MSSLLLAGLLVGTTPGVEAAVFPPVVITDASQMEVPAPWLAAFTRVLRSGAHDIFRERRWSIIEGGALNLALAAAPPRPIRSGPAHRKAASRLELNAWISPRIHRHLDGCRVEVFLMFEGDDEPQGSFRRSLTPCSLDGLVAAASVIPAALLEGPRQPWPVTVPLSATRVPDLHVRGLPDVPAVGVATSTVPQALEPSLAQYRQRAVLAFEDERGVLRFVRNGELLGECGLRRAVAAPISASTHSFCHGNDWVWAFLGVPVGGFVAWISYPDFEQGNLHGFVGFTAGVLGAVTSATLAAALMKFGTDPGEGRYLASSLELRALARGGNTRLRAELGLSEAEAKLALEPLRQGQ